jgi:hypothetical protein
VRVEAGGPVDAAQRRAARRKAAVVLPLLGAAVVALALRPPVTGDIYAPCPWRALTGTWCPGCGSLRGLGALVAGDPLVLPRTNALAALALPFLAWSLVSLLSVAVAGHRLPRLMPSRRAILLLAALVVAWGVLRNLVPALAPPPWE